MKTSKAIQALTIVIVMGYLPHAFASTFDQETEHTRLVKQCRAIQKALDAAEAAEATGQIIEKPGNYKESAPVMQLTQQDYKGCRERCIAHAKVDRYAKSRWENECRMTLHK